MTKSPVIDVAARRQVSALLREFVEGRLSNVELDVRYPGASADRAVHAVYRRLWRYQDDRGLAGRDFLGLYGFVGF